MNSTIFSCVVCDKTFPITESHTFCSMGQWLRYCEACCPRMMDGSDCDKDHATVDKIVEMHQALKDTGAYGSFENPLPVHFAQEPNVQFELKPLPIVSIPMSGQFTGSVMYDPIFVQQFADLCAQDQIVLTFKDGGVAKGVGHLSEFDPTTGQATFAVHGLEITQDLKKKAAYERYLRESWHGKMVAIGRKLKHLTAEQYGKLVAKCRLGRRLNAAKERIRQARWKKYRKTTPTAMTEAEWDNMNMSITVATNLLVNPRGAGVHYAE